jgi:hypothetical protein
MDIKCNRSAQTPLKHPMQVKHSRSLIIFSPARVLRNIAIGYRKWQYADGGSSEHGQKHGHNFCDPK